MAPASFRHAPADDRIGICQKITYTRVASTGQEIAAMALELIEAMIEPGDIVTPGKPTMHCSNDPLLGGDPALPNPEDLLLASLSACHMLWYLHLASSAKIVVHRYTDNPLGVGEVHPDGCGQFRSAILRPNIVVVPSADLEKAAAIHKDVHRYCFIARSVNFPISYKPTFSMLGR